MRRIMFLIVNKGIIVYLLLLLIIFTLIISTMLTVNYGITLDKDDLIQGEDFEITFKISNYIPLTDINNIVIEYWIVKDNTNFVDITRIIEEEKINSFSTYEKSKTITTDSLEEEGTYTLWTQLTYNVGTGGKGVGNREAKLLSWDITINKN